MARKTQASRDIKMRAFMMNKKKQILAQGPKKNWQTAQPQKISLLPKNKPLSEPKKSVLKSTSNIVQIPSLDDDETLLSEIDARLTALEEDIESSHQSLGSIDSLSRRFQQMETTTVSREELLQTLKNIIKESRRCYANVIEKTKVYESLENAELDKFDSMFKTGTRLCVFDSFTKMPRGDDGSEDIIVEAMIVDEITGTKQIVYVCCASENKTTNKKTLFVSEFSL